VLFGDRQSGTTALKDANDRLRLALDGAELGVWSVDLRTGRLESDARDQRINGHDPEAPAKTLAEARALIHPDDLQELDVLFAASALTGSSYKAEYRLAAGAGHKPADQGRWVAVEGVVVRGANGRPAQLLGITRDITERKNAELTLAERTLQLALAERAALVGSVVYDPETDKMQISHGYAAIHGFPAGTTEITRSEWQASVHPEDRERLEELRSRAFSQRSSEYTVDYRIVRRGGEVRWIDARLFIQYHADGRPQKVLGVNIDVSERKRAEEHQRTLNAELDHRVKNVLATVNAIIAQAPKPGSSLVDFVTGLDGRIRSLSRTHELLSRRHWRNISLAEIARRELEPYTGGNFDIAGPFVTMQAEAAQALAMVLHELATNAAKHGVFSEGSGRVLLRWWWQGNGSHDPLAIEWKEVGGPSVSAPSRPSYGTAIIRELIPFELDGAANLIFASEGIRCELEIPRKWLSPGSQLSDDTQELPSA
jgi:PAS domain S-box-containing protein